MTCNTYQFKPYCTCGLISNSRCLAVCRSTTPPYQSTSNAPDPTETTYFSSRHPSLTYVVKVHFKCVFLLLQHRSPITQARGQRTESSWEKKRIKNAVYVSWNSPPNSNAASCTEAEIGEIRDARLKVQGQIDGGGHCHILHVVDVQQLPGILGRKWLCS